MGQKIIENVPPKTINSYMLEDGTKKLGHVPIPCQILPGLEGGKRSSICVDFVEEESDQGAGS